MYFYKNPVEKKNDIKNDMDEIIKEDEVIMNINPYFKSKNRKSSDRKSSDSSKNELNKFTELFDPYEVLGISDKANIEEIKQSYKDLSLIHHPDKGGNEEIFSIINKAYRIAIMRVESVKPKEKIEHNELKTSSKNAFINNTSNRNFQGKNFNLNKFNEVYENNKLHNPYDEGYGKWDIELVNENASLNKNISQNTFNEEFNKTKSINNYNTQITVAKEPSATISGDLGFAELGIDSINSFTKSDNDTSNGINFTDYKDAYTTNSKLINAEVVQTDRPTSLNAFKIHRENVSYNMSEDEKKCEELKIMQEQEKEFNRMKNVNLFDEMALEHYNKVNQLMITK